jgi:hypothetical protein
MDVAPLCWAITNSTRRGAMIAISGSEVFAGKGEETVELAVEFAVIEEVAVLPLDRLMVVDAEIAVLVGTAVPLSRELNDELNVLAKDVAMCEGDARGLLDVGVRSVLIWVVLLNAEGLESTREDHKKGERRILRRAIAVSLRDTLIHGLSKRWA